MTKAVFAIPGDINLPTGGYAYDRRVLALLPSIGIDVRHLALPGSFREPTAADLAGRERLLATARGCTVLLIDGLAYGAMPADVDPRASRRPIVALVHHPLCLEAGLARSARRNCARSRTAALALAQHVIVTSPATARRWRRISPCRRQDHRRPAGHRPGAARQGQRAAAAAAGGRLDRAAQGLRRPGAGACAACGPPIGA